MKICNMCVCVFLAGIFFCGCGSNATIAPPQGEEPIAEVLITEGEVRTDLPIVYQNQDDSFVVLSHLDLSKRAQVIGIFSGGMCVALKHDRMDNWANTSRRTPSGWSLPQRGDGIKFFAEKDLFNRTVRTLRQQGIDADSWADNRQSGYYWTRNNVRHVPNWQYYFEMGTSGSDRGGSSDMNRYARFVRRMAR